MNTSRMNQIPAFGLRPGHSLVLAAIEADVLFSYPLVIFSHHDNT
jgi:hypothetical protein